MHPRLKVDLIETKSSLYSLWFLGSSAQLLEEDCLWMLFFLG
jgi:hypothetical protein